MPRKGEELATIDGTSGNDTLNGTTGDDTINGLGGNDAIFGGKGNDTINGGDGDDLIHGGAGNDIIDGGFGRDTIYGDAGNDEIHTGIGGLPNFGGDVFGGDGDDYIYMEGYFARADGGAGNDIIFGSQYGGIYSGGPGDDRFYGWDGAPGDWVTYETAAQGVTVSLAITTAQDTGDGVDILDGMENLIGSAFGDTLTGDSGANQLQGGDGDDTLSGGGGGDMLDGGLGNDWVDFGNAAGGINASLKNQGATESDLSVDSLLNFENIRGSVFGDILTGDDGDNQIFGGAGDDILGGWGGNDYLDGGDGNDVFQSGGGADTLVGGNGNDIYYFDPDDTIVELAGGGIDQINSVTSFVLGDNFENLVLTTNDAVDGTGNAANNVITGGDGNNQLMGLGANDMLNGGGGDDTLDGGDGNDTLNGGEGADTITDGAGSDHVDAGAGDFDTIYASIGAGSDSYDGGDGLHDLVNYSNALAGVQVSLGKGVATSIQSGDAAGIGTDHLANIEDIYGSAFDDILTGNAQANSLYGRDGNDVLNGGDGNDVISGGEGDDVFNGGSGIDRVSYTSSSVGVHVSLAVTTAQDTGQGQDTITGVENIYASFYDDDLTGNSAANFIWGFDGNDRLSGGGGADTLWGDIGDDYIDGGSGADEMEGGTGNDIFIVDNVGDVLVENAGEGTDTVSSSINFTLGDNLENLTLAGASPLSGTGNALANILTGNDAANHLYGLDGKDTLYGGAGKDVLDGGLGNDTMRGGIGDDSYVVDSISDRAIENAGEGTDTVMATATFTLGDNLENLTLTGSLAINGTGNALDNIITGSDAANRLFGLDGKDTLYGGGGKDVLDGGAGSDKMYGGAGNDLFVFKDGDFGGTGGATADRISDFSHAESDRIDLRAVDANSANGSATHEAFTFIGTDGFHNVAGELRYQEVNGNTLVYGDTNGDGLADFAIRLDGSHVLTSGDFIFG